MDQSRLLPLALTAGALLFVVAWFLLPASDFLVQPVAPNVRDDINEAIDKATDPAERADLRLRLADLEQEDAARRGSLRGTIATLLAGSVAAWGAVSAWRQLQDNQKHAEAVRKETDEQLRLARDAQLTERFTRAVDQLGSDRFDVRIASVYSLERIARDSESDLPTIVEVLSAFVRVRSPQARADDYSRLDAGEGRWVPPLATRLADVQVALTVLGRVRPGGQTASPDLSNSDLSGAELIDADLSHSVLTDSNLADAQFEGASLHATLFLRAYLRHTIFARADLTDAKLTGAILTGANLAGADLTGAQVANANLTQAIVTGARMVSATLRACNLQYAKLAEVDLRNTDLGGADLAEAWLGGADLRGAFTSGANFENAGANASTRWPDEFDHEAAGIVFFDRYDDFAMHQSPPPAD